MKIPKRINPDSIKDSIVQILFTPAIAPELFIGTFNQVFSDTFHFQVAPPKRREFKTTDTEAFFVEPVERGYFLDTDNKIKVDLSANAIVFNSFNEYVLWENYFLLIKNTIKRLFESKLISSVNRIGIRYISQFENKKLFDILKVDLNIGEFKTDDFETSHIRSEFNDDNCSVILTLINSKLSAQGLTPSSIVDIDIIQIFGESGVNDFAEVVKQIDHGHTKQKTTFFTLLKQEFLESLNPEY